MPVRRRAFGDKTLLEQRSQHLLPDRASSTKSSREGKDAVIGVRNGVAKDQLLRV